ncbi:MAG: hypothetical protein HOV68_07640, partial [Streptomycetaceae bacterium]|nr:hypothetical protein [Streptomycetaceae bacterium]
EEGLRGVAVAAYTRAAELGTGDGVPLLWRGWLRRAVDMDGALADLDRAAAAGGVVGPARHLQAEVFRQVARDPEATLAALARTTEEAPEDAEGWLSRGLRLAKYGRPAEAVEVLDRAVELHGGGKTAYYLGYARLLTGDRIGALTALEDAVRELPGLADTIVADPDLEALRGEPRFDGLPKLAANREAAHHRRVREAVRPSDPEARAGSETDAGGVGDRATDLGSVAEVHEVFRRKVDGIRKARSEAVTHEATRAFLADIGLPREAGEFRLDSTFDNIYGEALRAYELGGWRSRLTGDRIPDGLGGLLILGTLGEGADAALDGGTGEVYRVAEDFSLTWLAPSLESFFLPRCLPDDAWVWRLTPDTVHRLDGPDIARIAPGRLSLVGDGLTPADFARLTGFLREHGALVGYLRLDRNRSLDHDLTAVDLAEHCPNLRELWLRGGTVTTSVFTHPALERLHLTESTCRATEPEIRLDGDSRLHSVSLDDCLVHADSLYVGPRSPMRRFSSLIDEDYGFVFPERLEFDNCPDLYGITLDMDAGTWTLTLRGSLPKLREVRQDARPYGSFTYRIATANPADKKAYQSLIRKGARYARKD